MSYHIYTTKGLVLSERPIREADRLYSILTRELGLVRVRALGVRKGDSKLRGSLEPFAFASISLVRGKEYWTITSAELLRKLPGIPELARPFALIERLVQREGDHPELFDEIESHITHHLIPGDLAAKDSFETRLVAKILLHLGYLKESDLVLNKKELIMAINQGLHASQLF